MYMSQMSQMPVRKYEKSRGMEYLAKGLETIIIDTIISSRLMLLNSKWKNLRQIL